MKTCIIGASGYSGQVLVEILTQHPEVDLHTITSRQYEGKTVGEIIPRLSHLAQNLTFSNPSIEELKALPCDVYFLALPHGAAASFAIPLLNAGKKVIDLSADFRLSCPKRYEEFYGSVHPSPEWLSRAQYGLPEIHSLSWENSPLIASPGCYPTSILIPLSPLFAAGLIQKESVIANSISGVSGAGKTPSERLLFCERNESAGPYGLPKHRHLSEIEEQLSYFAKDDVVISFLPHLAPMNRGICSTITVYPQGNLSADAVRSCWEEYYTDRPFVQVLPDHTQPDVANVVGTNRIDLNVIPDTRTGRYIICSAEDNLLKGAGGQAVQSLNICMGLSESTGLP
jgi:N-acetyl-gamma-glutamyl-phosphate reductase